MLERFEEDGLTGHRSTLLRSLGVPHLFTTRLCRGQRDFDLGALDDRGRERLRAAAGAPDARIVHVRQVHGSRAVLVAPGAVPAGDVEADALVTELADVLLCVHVADCVPVLLAAQGGRRVAAVHAGWRGVVAGVIARAIEVLGRDGVTAAIGPCISVERYEIGPEVAEAFTRVGLALAVRERPGARPHLDLRAAVEHQLRGQDVTRIDTSDHCTYRDQEEFFSYRRDVTHAGRGHTGRLGALIGVTDRA